MAKKPAIKLARCLGDFLQAMGDESRFAMVGGLAVSARCEPRFTADVDVVVAAADETAAEALVFRLSRSGFLPLTVLERPDQGKMATVRLRQAPNAPIVDLLFAATGIENEIIDDAEPMSVLGHEIRVARAGHLIAMKLLARDDKRRPLDQADLLALSAVADAVEWKRADEAVRLIEERGFARGRDLKAALAEWRDEAGR
jgi:hypothetical protein